MSGECDCGEHCLDCRCKTKKTKRKKFEPQKLTYEEHKKIHEFIKNFNSECMEVFELVKKMFPDNSDPVKCLSKSINNLNYIVHFCENRSCIDRTGDNAYMSDDYVKWMSLYTGLGLCLTSGYYK